MTPEKIVEELRKMLKTPNGTFHYIADAEVVTEALKLIESLTKKGRTNGAAPVPVSIPERQADRGGAPGVDLFKS